MNDLNTFIYRQGPNNGIFTNTKTMQESRIVLCRIQYVDILVYFGCTQLPHAAVLVAQRLTASYAARQNEKSFVGAAAQSVSRRARSLHLSLTSRAFIQHIMRAKRSKKYRKLMHQYELTFGFREPYQVLGKILF